MNGMNEFTVLGRRTPNNADRHEPRPNVTMTHLRRSIPDIFTCEFMSLKYLHAPSQQSQPARSVTPLSSEKTRI